MKRLRMLKMNNRGVYAISQISLLILGIFAMSFLLGATSTVSASMTDSVPCKVVGSPAGCSDGEVCSANKICVKEVSESSDSGGSGQSVLQAGVSTLGAVEAVTKGPSTVKKAAGAIGNIFKPKAVSAISVPEYATGGLGETIAKNGAFKLYGNQVYWTSSGAEAAAGADIAAVAPAESAFIFGKGSITSGGFMHGVTTIVVYAAIAVAAALIARGIASLVGATSGQTNVITYTTGGAVFAGLITASIAGGPVGWAVGGVIAIIGVFGFYKLESGEIVKYQCLSYVPESGGDHCEECNDGKLPCTEYQCLSLGRSCELINQGTGEEMCVFTRRDDIRPPQVEAWFEILYDGYTYNPLVTNFPEDRGVRVISLGSSTGCVAPFEQIRFGITLDEPGICKYSSERTGTWEEMGSEYFSRGLSGYNHSISMTFPDKASAEAEGYEYDEGFNEFFVRCEDANGNQNVANFVFRFCVDDSPDLSTPTILSTNPLINSPIKFNQSSIDAMFYLNKPSECRWDRVDRSYDTMENEMSCASNLGDAVPYQYTMAYPCETSLTGIANYVENDYYIRCKSYPNKNETERIVMENSFKYTLLGTRPITIEEAEPNETMRGSADVMEVELYARTSGGTNNEGEAICYFSQTDQDSKYLTFFNTNSYMHTQNLWLGSGAYKYFIKCVDRGGNIAKTEVNFVVESDTTPPLVARAYSEDGFLKIATNEESRCVYSTFGCDYAFEDGTSMSHSEYISHFTPWDSSMNLYIKCEDIYQNRPLSQNECSIIVRAYDEFVDPNN